MGTTTMAGPKRCVIGSGLFLALGLFITPYALYLVVPMLVIAGVWALWPQDASSDAGH